MIYAGVGDILPIFVGGAGLLRKPRAGRGQALRTYAYCFMPLGLALHAAHNFHHLSGEGAAVWAGLDRALAHYAGWTSLAPQSAAAVSAVPKFFVVL